MKRNLKSLTESELIDMAKSDDKELFDLAFGEIYKRHHKAVRYFLLKKISGMSGIAEDHDDMVQTVFEKAFKGIKNFQPEYRISTWLMKIAKNYATDVFRKKSLKTTNVVIEDEDGMETTMDFADNTYNPEKASVKDQRIQFVHKLINDRLDGDYKRIIELIYLEEKSYQEVADILEIPIGTIKAKIFRAKKLLSAGLTKDLILTA